MKYFFLVTFVSIAAMTSIAQSASNEPWPPFPGQRRPDDDSRIVKGMVAKQQALREKKEYAELLEKGKNALRLSEDLAKSLEKNKVFSDAERKQLAEFEKLLEKIRDDLGGGDDGESSITDKGAQPPKDVREGVLYLKRSTENLLGELKRSTRFSVSVAAIESSNTLIRLARFLRLKN